MDKALFRISAWIVFISLSVSVFLCIYVSPVAMDMPEMSHVNVFSSHLDHIKLFTSAVTDEVVFLILLALCFLISAFFLNIGFFCGASSQLYKEPPGMRYRLATAFAVNERAPPLD